MEGAPTTPKEEEFAEGTGQRAKLASMKDAPIKPKKEAYVVGMGRRMEQVQR